jgi:hypothetical protein
MARAPSVRAGLATAREAHALGRLDAERKNPAPKAFGAGFWRRPTLARPFVALPSGLQRFTAVFGMGTGGATALLSPESDAEPAFRRFAARQAADAEPWGL